MQVFMRNIAIGVIEEDLQLQFAAIFHRPPFSTDPLINFDVAILRKRNRHEHSGVGLLTLPSEDIGRTFLGLYDKVGITVKGRKIMFLPSNKSPNHKLIERVRSVPWEDPKVLQAERARIASASKEVSLRSFSFGRLCRDRSFSAEVDTEELGDLHVVCDIAARQLLFRVKVRKEFSIEGFGFPFDGNPTTVLLGHDVTTVRYPSSLIIALFASPISGDIHHVFIEANSPPLFEGTTTSAFPFPESPTTPKRLPSLDEHGTMPPVTRCVCMTFTSRGDMETFLRGCKTLRLPHPVELDIPVVQRSIYSKNNLVQLDHFYKELIFGIAYEAEKSIANTLLDPIELLMLRDQILELQCDSEHAIFIFRHFVSDLHVPTFAGGFNRRRGRGFPELRGVESPDLASLSVLLHESATKYHAQLARPRSFFSASPATYQSYQLIITPSTMLLEGPLPDRGNAVLRRFGHHEHFLRVSFQDESRSRLYHNAGLRTGEPIGSRFLALIVDGFRLAGRQWEFLGYSMSGLKEHSVWFMNPFKSDDEVLMNAAHVRSLLGDFSKIERKPARLAARWSQAFTSSDPSVTLESSEILPIPDRYSRNGSNFTDGCGTISPTLAREVWSKLQSLNRKSSRLKTTPSCFQIRLGGAKGVVVQDPNLKNGVICLRPSQIKFDLPRARTLALDVASTSAKPMAMFLNRPLIVLLEYLGVPLESFSKLQKQTISHVEKSRTSLLGGSDLFQQHGLGASYRLPSLFARLDDVLNLEIQGRSDQSLYYELIEACLALAAIHVLREVKYRAHIPVPGSFTLLGVADELDYLEAGQVYATVKDERTGLHQPILGKILITRSPQIHPGDVQFVEAVSHPGLQHLVNVVVFSCKGQRSLPSCLGGGDLDGDHYNLILDPTLFPKTTSEPGSYISLPDKTIETPCTTKDVANFVLDYMNSDLVGYISILHLRIADLKDPGCEDCLKLAEACSQAVDFPKTGTAVDFDILPRIDQPLKPDFLSHEGANPDSKMYYRSPKALGSLFRDVPKLDYHSSDGESSMSWTDLKKISNALKCLPLKDFGLPDLEAPSMSLVQEMKYVLCHYGNQLKAIAKAYVLSRSPNHHLSEGELVTGTIRANWGSHRERKEAADAMNFQTQELTMAVRRELRRTQSHPASVQTHDELEHEGDDEEYDFEKSFHAEEILARSWAAWNVAEDAILQDPEAFGPQSFGLIALGSLLKVVHEARSSI